MILTSRKLIITMSYDRSNMENVWRQYHALGGNGDMNDLRRTFRHLPMAEGSAPIEVTE